MTGKKFENDLAEFLYAEMVPDDSVGSSSDGVGWAGMFIAPESGKVHIVEETPDGLVAVFTYPEAESAMRWAEVEERLSMDGDEPSEDDYVVQEGTGGYTVSQYGKTWTFSEYGDVEKFIRTHMEQEQFWPSVWHVSDHGNYTRWELSNEASTNK